MSAEVQFNTKRSCWGI